MWSFKSATDLYEFKKVRISITLAVNSLMCPIMYSLNQPQPVSHYLQTPHRSSHFRSPTDKSASSPFWAASSRESMTSPWRPSSRCNRPALRCTKLRIWSLGDALPWNESWKFQAQMVAYLGGGATPFGTSPGRSFCTLHCLASRVRSLAFVLRCLIIVFVVLNIVTNRVVRLLGKDEVVRFLNFGIYQGAPAKKGLTTMVCNIRLYYLLTRHDLVHRPWLLPRILSLLTRGNEIQPCFVRGTNAPGSTCSHVPNPSK